MVRPQELVESLLYTLQQSEHVPDETSFVGYEPDLGSEPIDLPMIEVSTGIMTDMNPMNTDYVEPKLDDSGNEIALIYQSDYEIEITIAVWTAHGSKFSPRNLSNVVRDKLYEHNQFGPNKPLRNPDGEPIEEVWRFKLLDGQQNDNLSTTPSLRRWEHTVLIGALEQYIVQPEEEVIAAFNENVS